MSNKESMRSSGLKTSVSLEERVTSLVQKLTIEEKIQCLTTHQKAITRLGLPEFSIGGEAAHGVEARHDQVFNEGKSVATTVFTEPIGMSATWDTPLIKQAGEVTGREARAVYAMEGKIGLSRWAPTVDMERDPRWGRNEEGYGEDPYLTGMMASAYIKGMQGDDPDYLQCAATLKHFYANNEETDRVFSSSSLDRRNKWEYYLEPFRRTIMDGRCESVMTSYNEINGIPSIVNPEVREVLKGTFGLRGHVVCDMVDLAQTKDEHHFVESHAEALSLALKAGIDVFNDPEEFVIKTAQEALEQGLITEKEIDEAIKRSFATKFRLGLLDGEDCPYNKIGPDCLNSKEHQEVSLKVAKEAVILLQNEDHFLPLQEKDGESLAVVGPLAGEWFQDWYAGNPKNRSTPWQGIKERFPKAKLTLTNGADLVQIRIGEKYVAIHQDGSCYATGKEDAEVFERMDWGEYGMTLRAVSSHKYVTVEGQLLYAKKSEVFSWNMEEVFSFVPVEDGQWEWKLFDGSYAAVNEAGEIVKMPQPIPVTMEVLVDGIKEAKESASKADKVIVVLGCHPIICGKEDLDRVGIELPKRQQELLEAVYGTNPNVALVLIANYPYAIGWAEKHIPAILTTASGSQDLGTAVAEILAGDTSPAGRLNMTWYESDRDLPEMRDYDIIRGKRTYQYYEDNVLYPFGYGLSYTEFEYKKLTVKQEGDGYRLNVTVKNIGTIDSDEVVQLYVSQKTSRTVRPIKQLKGFTRVHILAGEETTVSFTLSVSELSYYDVVTAQMLVEDGDYEVMVGGASNKIQKSVTIHVNGVRIPYRDMKKRIYCDQYDDCRNLLLVRGKDACPAMMQKREEEYGMAVYHDVRFTSEPSEMYLEIAAKEEGTITVFYGNEQWISTNIEKVKESKEISIPIHKSGSVKGRYDDLLIQLTKGVGIISFGFLSMEKGE